MALPSPHNSSRNEAPTWEVCFGDSIEEAIDYGIVCSKSYYIEGAVSLAAKEFDAANSDYTILQATEYPAWARLQGDSEWTPMVVYGESSPRYTAYIQRTR